MTSAAITAAAILRCRRSTVIPVNDRRGRRVGHVAQNHFGTWESFTDSGHIPGVHLSARGAIVAILESVHHKT